MAASKHRSLFFTVLRATIGISLAAYVIFRILRHAEVDLASAFAQCKWSLIALAFLFYAALLAMTIVRWYILLIVQDIRLRAMSLVKLTMIGIFWSGVIPGTVTGDFVKMYYIARQAGEKTSAAVLTIVLDRLLGLMGLFIVASISVLFALDFIRTAPDHLQVAVGIITGGSICGLASVVAIAFREQLQRLPGVRHLIKFGARALPDKVTGIIARMSEALDLYRTKPRAVVLALLFSVIGHSAFAMAVYCIGKAVGEEIISIAMYFVTVQVANCIASIPLTPAGLGSRDWVISLFFTELGADGAKAAVVAVGLSLIIVTWTAIAGVFWILSRRHGEGPNGSDSKIDGIAPSG